MSSQNFSYETRFGQFPDGDWEVLGGGYVGLSNAPIPEYDYTFPCIRTDSGRPNEFRLIRCALGDLALFCPGMVFSDTVPQLDVAPSMERHLLEISDEPDDRERTLARLLPKLSPVCSQGRERLDKLSKLLAALPQCGEIPLVVYKRADGGYFAAFSAEWYRFLYGHKPYLANAYMAGSAELLVANLVEPEFTRALTDDELAELEVVPTGEEWIGFVPRKDVDDAEGALIASYLSPLSGTENRSLTNAHYSSASMLAVRAQGTERLAWLKFRHAYAGQKLDVEASGISAQIRTDAGEKVPIFFASGIRGQAAPDHPAFAILRRENESRPFDQDLPLDPDSPASTDSETKHVPEMDWDHATDGELTPDENPMPGALPVIHRGIERKIFGAPPPRKLPRKRSGDPDRVRTRPLGVEGDTPGRLQTTNQSKSTSGSARPAHTEAPENSTELVGYDMVANCLVEVAKADEIQELAALDFSTSCYFYKHLRLQQFQVTLGAGKHRKWELGGKASPRPRLIFSATFRYGGQRFAVLDIERRTKSESFSFLLVAAPPDAEDLAPSMQGVADRLLKTQGKFKGADVSVSFPSYEICRHVRDKSKPEGHPSTLRWSYFESQLEKLSK